MVNSKYFYQDLIEDIELGQGDIFSALPFNQFDSEQILELKVEGETITPKEIDLQNYIATKPRKIKVVTNSILQPAIIITQNCDILRSPFISYCRIAPFSEIEKNIPTQKKKKLDLLVRPDKSVDKYFYLPQERPYGFEEEMAVDFSCIQQIKREILVKLIALRKSRINSIALEHFQVKISYYFKRFAYNGWYVLNKEDFDFYKSTIGNETERDRVAAYDWQKD